ncbi:MAG: hypothetical protein MJZ03_05135, partial [archaeon]|nr:hypothetical protein [archaeon]
DSSATTTLGRRTAEALAQLGYSVDVYPAEISGNHFTYPDEYNGVRIISPEAGAEMNYSPVNPSETHTITERHLSELRKILDSKDYDYVFSVALAFEVHFLVHQVLEGRRSKVEGQKSKEDGRVGILDLRPWTLDSKIVSQIKWFPMSYDPYAFNPHITEKQKQEYIRQEVETLQDATKIFFLTEFANDYIGSPIEDKIVYFNLPCIRPIDPDRTKRVIEFDDSYINCVFLGDFYFGNENTDFIFRLFEKVEGRRSKAEGRSEIRFYTIGSVCDYRETVDLWQKKLGDGYICHERTSQEEAHNAMLDCDVLVSMGHDSANMCPSKAIDFASSGKPILHIQKIENCCAKRYLERYPDKCFIYQNEELTDERVKEVEQFILSAKGKETIPFDMVKELYNDFTMEALIEKILKEFDE